MDVQPVNFKKDKQGIAYKYHSSLEKIKDYAFCG